MTKLFLTLIFWESVKRFTKFGQRSTQHGKIVFYAFRHATEFTKQLSVRINGKSAFEENSIKRK